MAVLNEKEEVLRLKKERRAVILAHYYTYPEVQDAADFVGDSLALSQQAATTDAEVILFAGVHFMAETAKVLSPEKIVLLPDVEAGCSLAESCEAATFAKFRAQYPGHTVISYVNTSVAVKALSDVLCTSSNVVKIVDSVPRGAGILFGPDRNLGQYVIDMTGRDDIILWNGACHVHERFTAGNVGRAKAEHPGAKVLVHPECSPEVRALADYTGSTSGIIEYAARSEAKEFIVVTEAGILYPLQKRAPGKKFYPVAVEEGKPSECEYMKLVTLEKIHISLKELTTQVVLDEKIRQQAEGSIRRMLELSK